MDLQHLDSSTPCTELVGCRVSAELGVQVMVVSNSKGGKLRQ
jgi:hypothetical protein